MNLLPSNFYFDDLFNDFSPICKVSKLDFFKCDIYELDDVVHIEVDIPGYKKEDISINFDNGILNIEASNVKSKTSEDVHYYKKERIFGSFKRQFNIGNIDEKKINASFNNGVLDISFPKEQNKESKKIIEIQ